MLTGNTEILLRVQTVVLEAVARGEELGEVGTILCRQVEAVAPGVICSILLITDGLVHPLAGPSLPDDYSRALEGVPVGPRSGSCGTAAWRDEPVIVTDIATGPLWAQGKLPNKAVAAFAGAMNAHGGQESTILALHNTF